MYAKFCGNREKINCDYYCVKTNIHNINSMEKPENLIWGPVLVDIPGSRAAMITSPIARFSLRKFTINMIVPLYSNKFLNEKEQSKFKTITTVWW